nr:hypothetical protein [Tanacetum cinerariifolium]
STAGESVTALGVFTHAVADVGHDNEVACGQAKDDCYSWVHVLSVPR